MSLPELILQSLHCNQVPVAFPIWERGAGAEFKSIYAGTQAVRMAEAWANVVGAVEVRKPRTKSRSSPKSDVFHDVMHRQGS